MQSVIMNKENCSRLLFVLTTVAILLPEPTISLGQTVEVVPKFRARLCLRIAGQGEGHEEPKA